MVRGISRFWGFSKLKLQECVERLNVARLLSFEGAANG